MEGEVTRAGHIDMEWHAKPHTQSSKAEPVFLAAGKHQTGTERDRKVSLFSTALFSFAVEAEGSLWLHRILPAVKPSPRVSYL